MPGQNHKGTLVYAGDEYKRLSEREFIINPALNEDFKRLFREIDINQDSWGEVIYLWGLNAVKSSQLTVTELESASKIGCGGLLCLIQSLINQGLSSLPRLWVVTQGAQRVGEESQLGGVAQSSLWGLGQAINSEHPELKCILVDLAEKDSCEPQHLFREICTHQPNNPENQVAFRQGQRYVKRLVRSPKIVKQALNFQAEATYLITGGLGEIGLLLAEWMVEKGAKCLVLVGRSQPSETAKIALKRLEEAGSRVVVLQTDVSVEKDVASLLNQIKAEMPPLKGIIHAAGVSEARLLAEHQWPLFAQVLAPKVSGAWNLHYLTQDLPLDFFVLFSSGASLLVGIEGLGGYATANAFLDGLAHYRRSLNLPGLSINWGPWSSIGMAKAIGSKGENQWLSKGIKAIEAQKYLNVLEKLLFQDKAQVGVIQVNWSKFLQQFPNSSYPGFVAEMVPMLTSDDRKEEQKQVDNSQILEQIKTSSPEQSQSLLLNYLSHQIAKALGMSQSALNVDESLNKMGLDSLMVVELKNRLRTDLEVNISITKFLEGVSVVGLKKVVEEQLFVISSVLKTKTTDTTTATDNQNNWIEGEL